MRVPLVSVNVKGGDGCNYDNAVSGMQVVCAVAPLKEMSHSVVLSSDVAADLEGMPATGAVSERVNEVVVDCCMSASCDYMDNVVNAALDHDDAGEPDGSNVDVRVDQLLSGDDEVESRMSANVVRVFDRVCTIEVSNDVVVAVADCGSAAEAECECVTPTVVHVLTLRAC